MFPEVEKKRNLEGLMRNISKPIFIFSNTGYRKGVSFHPKGLFG